MIRTTTRNATMIARAIKGNESFTTSGALKGDANPAWVDPGRMTDSDSAAMRTAHDLIGIDFVVYSYATPIAYRTQDGNWTIPDAKYSVTTSKHQSVVSYAVRIAS